MNTLCCFLEGLEADNWFVFSFREYFLILFIAVPDFSLISWLAKKSCFQRITAANGCGYVWASKVLIWNKTLHDLAVFFCHLKESSLQSQNASKTRLFSRSVSEWSFDVRALNDCCFGWGRWEERTLFDVCSVTMTSVKNATTCGSTSSVTRSLWPNKRHSAKHI